MSGFAAASFETLDYDFTGIPCAQQPEPTPENPTPARAMCSGKGIVHEPTTARLGRFLEYIDEGRRAIREAIAAAAKQSDVEDDAKPASEQYAETLNGLRAALADFCHGSPTREQIDELPPRALTAFFRWLTGEFLPKG